MKEAILAIKLSRDQTKEQVLENYLNTIYFGRGAYGIQAASQAYFGKDVQDLNEAQGAVLAAVIRAPNSYDPEDGKVEKQALKARTLDYVIPGMVEQGWLDEADAAKIRRLPKIADPQSLNSYTGQTGFMLDMVRDELIDLGFSDRRDRRRRTPGRHDFRRAGPGRRADRRHRELPATSE